LAAPRGSAGIGPAAPGAPKRIKIMAVKPAAKTTSAKAAKAERPITIERARLVCPHAGIAEKVAEAFGLTVPDFDGIREAHESALRQMWHSFDEALNERATQMHFQRITGSLVASALRAGEFYSEKVTEAKRATSPLFSDARDEDRDGPVGFESRADRVRNFAAQMAMQAYALLAAAEGAIAAYKDITGEDWKPYQADAQGPNTVERKAASAQISAFERAV
jgi:hypothetical protein